MLRWTRTSAEGLLVNAREVGNSWVDKVLRMRARLLAIPTKAAPLVAVERDAAAAEAVLTPMVEDALAELEN